MLFDPTLIAGFLTDLLTKEVMYVAILTFFTCYGIFKAFEPQDDNGRWMARWKVLTSLIVGAAWGIIVLPVMTPETGYVMATVLGVLAGGATTITVDQFKH